jgi:predicted metal-binding membrane protein
VAAIAWSYLLRGAGIDMHVAMDHVAMEMPPEAWTWDYTVVMFTMWWVMMIAMMLPSAAAVPLLVAALNRRSQPGRMPYGTTGFFAAGYLLAWAFFSVAAVAAQWWLAQSGLLSAMMEATSPRLAGVLLIAAGVWQVTPFKQACLRRCRSPVQFVTERRRPGNRGGLLMGIEHGAFCVGCCWTLMALLFVGGVMNLYWIVGLAAFVLIEKLLPAGQRIGQVAGAASALWGLVLLGGWS